VSDTVFVPNVGGLAFRQASAELAHILGTGENCTYQRDFTLLSLRAAEAPDTNAVTIRLTGSMPPTRPGVAD
jgi:hypothetical protein